MLFSKTSILPFTFSISIERLNVCNEENDRLKDYILVLEADVNLLSETLSDMEYRLDEIEYNKLK